MTIIDESMMTKPTRQPAQRGYTLVKFAATDLPKFYHIREQKIRPQPKIITLAVITGIYNPRLKP